jgi:hypothetical protein
MSIEDPFGVAAAAAAAAASFSPLPNFSSMKVREPSIIDDEQSISSGSALSAEDAAAEALNVVNAVQASKEAALNLVRFIAVNTTVPHGACMRRNSHC